MAANNIYKMHIGDVEFIGTIRELAEVSGYAPASIGMIARGEMAAKKGITVELIGKEESKFCTNWRNDTKVLRDWDNTVALFKNVKWVRRGSGIGIKLEVVR